MAAKAGLIEAMLLLSTEKVHQDILERAVQIITRAAKQMKIPP
jgi:hypothetical protein